MDTLRANQATAAGVVGGAATLGASGGATGLAVPLEHENPGWCGRTIGIILLSYKGIPSRSLTARP